MRFPDFACLVSQTEEKAWVLRRKHLVKMAETVALDIRGGEPPATLKAFDSIAFSAVCEATLLTAPYIRVAAPAPEGLVSQLRLGKLTLILEGEVILADSPVESHFGDPKEEIPPKPLFDLRAKHLFQARRVGVGDDGEQMTSDEVIGVFLSKQHLTAVITGIPTAVPGRIEVEIGGVAALYTSLTEEQEKEVRERNRWKPD